MKEKRLFRVKLEAFITNWILFEFREIRVHF